MHLRATSLAAHAHGDSCEHSVLHLARGGDLAAAGAAACDRMEESKSGEVLVCHIAHVSTTFWTKVVMFLAWHDASALHATSAAVRSHTTGKWSPRWSVAAERVALAAVAAANTNWKQLGWDGANPVGVAKFVVAPGRHSAGLVQRIDLPGKRLRGAWSAENHNPDCFVGP